jgi:predicted transcriptional regulator
MPGRPKDVSDREILEAIKIVFGPAKAGEISERIDLKNSGTNKRLDDLHKRELIHKKNVGANAAVYWLTDKGEEYLYSATDSGK